MLCAKYQEAGLCGSREKCDRNYLESKFAYVHNIQNHVKQEVDMPQIKKCVTQYSSLYWCSVPNIRKLASVVPEKNVTEIFCDANDDARRQKWSLYVASAKAGRRHNNDNAQVSKLTSAFSSGELNRLVMVSGEVEIISWKQWEQNYISDESKIMICHNERVYMWRKAASDLVSQRVKDQGQSLKLWCGRGNFLVQSCCKWKY